MVQKQHINNNNLSSIRRRKQYNYTEETEQIKNGIKIKIPIIYLTNEWYEIYPSSRKAKILGYGKIPLNEFVEEKNMRETLLRKIISEQIDEGSITTPRA